MIKRLVQAINLVIMSLLIVFSSGSCALKVYACEVIENESIEFVSEKDNSNNHIIQIGQSTYDAQYYSSQKSTLTNEIFDIYEIVEESSDLIKSYIRIDSESGRIIGFSNINPYPNIDNIDEMSDAELKETVELMMWNLADFTQYNEFKVKRPQSSNSHYYLVWQVKREALCNINVQIHITAEGAIKDFSIIDACPPNLTKSFISNAERDKLIQKRIKKHLAVYSLEGITYEIYSEILSYYHNTQAIIYQVTIVENGFEQLICFVIY